MAKVTFETKDREEILRLAHADQMANFIWELVHNAWRKFEHEPNEYDYEPAWEVIFELLEENGIDIDKLTS